MTKIERTAVESAEWAASILDKAAREFRAGDKVWAVTRVEGAVSILASIGEGPFSRRGDGIVAYAHDMPEPAAIMCERMAAEVRDLIKGGFIG